MTKRVLTKEEFENYSPRHFSHPSELDTFLNDIAQEDDAKLIEALAPVSYEEYLDIVGA